MKIRPFVTLDTEPVIDLWTDCGLVVPQNDPRKDIQRKLLVAPELFLVGALGETIVASVMGGYEGHRGWINYLAVSPAHRRRGYGKAMMDAVERRLAERGCPKINLQIRAANTGVIEFYQALGFADDHVVGLGKRLEVD